MRGLPTVAALALAALLALPAVPAAVAQEGHRHGGGSGVALVSDLGPTGTTFVGALNRFTIIAFGGDDLPDFHQDLPLRITLDGTEAFALDADAGHDYDGVRDTWIAFGRPGRYRVEALDGSGNVTARLDGEVRQAPPIPGAFGLHAEIGNGLGAGPIRAAVRLDADDRTEPRDFLVDLRAPPAAGTVGRLSPPVSGRIEFSAPLRGPEGAVGFQVAAQSPGAQMLAVTHYDADPATRAHPLPVGAAAQAMPSLGSALAAPGHVPAAAAPPIPDNAVVSSPEGPLRLVATYDPWTKVGPQSLMTIGVLALDASGGLAANVTVASELTDPRGRLLWQSADGFAPAGAWTLSTLQATPGLYVLQVRARSAAGEASLDVPWIVLPPADAASVGPVTVAADGLDGLQAGTPARLAFTARDGAGQPLRHGELVVDVWGPAPGLHLPPVRDEDTLLLRTKLHTHGEGAFRMAFAPPVPGAYRILVTPTPLEARPVVLGTYDFPAAVGGAAQEAQEAQGAGAAGGAEGAQAVPHPAVGLVAALGLAAVGWARRRQGRVA